MRDTEHMDMVDDIKDEALSKPARKPRAKKPPAAALTAREKAVELYRRENPGVPADRIVVTKIRSRKVIRVQNKGDGLTRMEWTYDALAPAPKKAAPKKRSTPKGEVQASL